MKLSVRKLIADIIDESDDEDLIIELSELSSRIKKGLSDDCSLGELQLILGDRYQNYIKEKMN